MALLGKGHFSDAQVQRWEAAHSAAVSERPFAQRIKVTWLRIFADWRNGFLFIPLVIAAGILLRNRQAFFLGLILVIQLIIWVGFTHLQGRFFILLIPIGAVLIGIVQARTWPWIATSGIALIAVYSFVILNMRFAGMRKIAEQPALGVENLTWLVQVPQQIDVEKLPADRPVILVGDAQALLYSNLPMTRLRYHTVFDVPAPDGGDWLDKWTQGERGTILVFPGELERLRKSYMNLPLPPENSIKGRPPFILEK
jgi:hypothetical protein